MVTMIELVFDLARPPAERLHAALAHLHLAKTKIQPVQQEPIREGDLPI